MFMGLEITSFAFYNRCTAKFWYACLRVMVVLGKYPTHSPQGITDLLLYHFQVHPKYSHQASGWSSELTNAYKLLFKPG